MGRKNFILGLIGIGCLLAGALIGWWVGRNQATLLTNQLAASKQEQVKACVDKLQAECKQQLTFKKYLVDPISNWPGLITGSSLNFQLGGRIAKIDKGSKKGRETTVYAIAGTQFPSQVSVYVINGADYVKTFQGPNMDNPTNLKPAKLSDFAIGDTVYIEASTPTLDNPKLLTESILADQLDLEAKLLFKFTK